jgi:class 3 adenylate cyclase/tetratricopeptide (TPR) repeat protein
MRDIDSASRAAQELSPGAVNPYVPRIVLRQLADDPDRRSWTVEGTVVFVDISGFTKLSERLAKKGREGAEQITEAIGGSFEAILSVAYENGGGLIKFGGDALLLLFQGEQHLERACRATLMMRRVLREVGRIEVPGAKVTLRMSQGLHSGLFHFFLVGGSHRELLPVGPGWSQTVAMEHDADAGEIVISPEAAALLPGRCLGPSKGRGVLLRRAPNVSGEQALTDEAVIVPPDLVASCLPVAARAHLVAGGGTPEHRPVTIAFLHFDETDTLIQRHGIDVACERLEHLVMTVQAAADEHGVGFLASDVDADGGKLILTAGAPRITGDDEERMLLALRRIVDEGTPVPIRVGVHRGSVFAGDIGPWYRRTYTVMGDAVNLAARLMAKAEKGSILATAEVLDRSNTLFSMTELEPFPVKGKVEPVRAWEVGAAQGSRTRQAELERFPLSGRSAEVASIRAAIESVRAGEGRLVEVIGEPGIGKSRLLEELRAESEDLSTLRATCEAYTASTPYITWRELMRELLSIGWQDTDEAVGERLRVALNESEPELLPWLPLIASVFDAELAPTPEMLVLAEEGRRERLHQSIVRFLEVMVPEPLSLQIEDAHHMDEASADLLSYVARHLEGHPWLISVSRRPADVGFEAPEISAVELLDLGPLALDDTLEMAKASSERYPLASHLMDLVVERSGGNPQFLLDLVHAASSSGGAGGLPESAQAAAIARIDALSPEDRALVRRAALFGLSFDPRMLAWVLEGEQIPDPDTWVRLAELFEFVEADGYLRFRRALVRDAAYEGLPYKLRRLLHGEIARRLEADLAHPEEAAGLLSLHFIVAGLPEQAWRYAPIAASRARELYANVEAARLYSRAVEAGKRLPDVDDRELARLHEEIGDSWNRAGEFQRAAAAFTIARRLVGDSPLDASRLLLKRSKMEEKLGRYPQSLAWVTRARRLVEGLDSREAVGRSAQLSAWYATVLQAEGRTKDALVWCERAIADAERADDQEALAQAYNVLGWVDTMMGGTTGERYLQKALEIYERLGDLAQQAKIQGNLGAVAYFAGRWDEAVQFWERGREAHLTVGQPVDAANDDTNIGEVLADQGHLREAEALLRDTLRVWKAAGDRGAYAASLGQLAPVCLRSGRHDEALSLLAEARQTFQDVGAQADVLETDAKIAECYAFVGRSRDALALADQTLAKGGRTVVGPRLERVVGYARLQLGDVAGAREAFMSSLAVSRERGADFDVAMALRASAQLDRVEGRPPDESRIDEMRAIFARLRVIAAPAIPVVVPPDTGGGVRTRDERPR